jgi:glycosyltransferase involved in cell wall biosynthesis
MDRYATRLAASLQQYEPDLDVQLAGPVAGLTVDPESSIEGVRVSDPRGHPQVPGPALSELRRYVARYWRYPRRVRRLEGDLVHVLDHSYGHLLLGARKRPMLVTVHDLLPLITVRQGARGTREGVRNWLLRRALDGVKRADAWIVATEWLRQELGAWLGSEQGVHVIPYGVDDAFFEQPKETRAETRQRWSLPADAFVVLHVGSVGPRKNIPAVIAAVAGLRDAGFDAWLLQVGGSFSAEQRAELARHGIKDATRSVGEAAEPDLRAAYRAADALLFPSHYEGFGFPVLEAMASGLPVVTSGAGGSAEVAGEDAVVVSGRETKPYVTALRRLAEDKPWRDDLVARGLKRAGRYRWADTASRTAEVYRSLV